MGSFTPEPRFVQFAMKYQFRAAVTGLDLPVRTARTKPVSAAIATNPLKATRQPAWTVT
jgi:hypothetical protein